jgi:hypothetical protein
MSDRNELDMSDEDFLQSYPTDFAPVEEETLDLTEESVSESPEEPTEPLEEEEVGQDEVDSEESPEALEEDEQSESDEEGTEGDDDEEVEPEEDNEEGGYKEQLDKLLSPFKANGVDMQVKDVDEAISLMQMGANYNKKMTALKPNLKKMKMLQNNDLFEEDKINLLIEVAKGNPDAITKVIKDSGIDPLDLNLEGNEYTPKNHTVGDNEVELDEVVARIQDTPSFSDTMNILSSKWDESSKRSIASAPHQLEVLNTHVANGIYATVASEVERVRMLGGLSGLSDLDAYKQVGDRLYQEGKISLGESKESKPKEIATKPAKAKVDKQKDKKRSASPVRSTASAKPTIEDFDPLGMSDEDFEKQFN